MTRHIMTFKCIIAGGRDFADYSLLQDKCRKLLTNKSDIVIVSGMANGADKLGEVFAAYERYGIKRFKADWEDLDVTPCLIRQKGLNQPYNALAGNIRNKEMGEYADAAIIFWNGVSKGSKDMWDIMNILNKPARIVRY